MPLLLPLYGVVKEQKCYLGKGGRVAIIGRGMESRGAKTADREEATSLGLNVRLAFKSFRLFLTSSVVHHKEGMPLYELVGIVSVTSQCLGHLKY